jgi:pimeloyl-ACP methyl ester carboxylesterase
VPLLSDASTQLIEVDGRPLNVAQRGDGPPLLLLNGIGLPLQLWTRLEPHLSDFRLVEVDLPGSGGSPPERAPVTMSGYAALIRGLLDALGIDSADVLGLSFGGMVAQQLAIETPSRVRRLVLASTSCGWGGVLSNPLMLPDTLLDGLAGPPTTDRRRVGRRSSYGLLRAEFGANGSRLPRPRAYLRQLVAASMWSSLAWLPSVQIPTLIVAGSADLVVPVANAYLLAGWLPRGHVHLVDGGGHLCPLDQPAEVGPVVAEFLRDWPTAALAEGGCAEVREG